MKQEQLKREKPDYWLILVTFLLLGFGLVMVFSSSYYKGLLDYHDSYFFIKRQLIYALLGLLLFFIVSNINYNFYRKHVGIMLLLSIGFLAAVLLLADRINGARRWLELGEFSFQPSEFVKLVVVIYMASIMVKKQPIIDQFKRALMPPLIVIGIICLFLVKQPHFSATVVVLTTSIVIIYCAGAKLKHLFFLFLSGIPIMIGILYMDDYRVKRLATVFNPFSDPQNSGYQTISSLYAIAPGGLTGAGLGNSIQKMAYLPEAHNDFIFSIIAEELGFFGGAALILLFIVFVVRGIRIAVQAPDQFGTLLGIGIVTLLAVETIFNLGVVTALLPVTGISLPFISYGGTSLLFKLVAMGILLNLSRYRKVKKGQAKHVKVS
ncbi:putative lipid II flippase FtsW [Thermoflavimicrobium daqui]|jgi:cell division protein FtsW|uniref:Probable peptidoglycan glycosyltransferase FtsW n=1 Tax=Thermoflavimicrobium daqui TaxID=2137476 RepID=A0A364K6G5_9BACL|nr:putative lipid II flippase FtsW [Thermoflavimicrobium daqui]RAL25899.1 putative lipid II flippase FtsW [Thermoflavimicrobium daqui]